MVRTMISLLGSAVGLLLVVPVLALLAPIWIICALVNMFAALYTRSGASWSQILQFEPGVGWKPRPNLDTVYVDRVGDSWTIKTDEDGWPGAHTIEESDVVVIGDSFAFGYGAPTASAYYSMADGCRIKPIGAPGYNMVQELVLMKQMAGRLKGKVVVWFACIENDLAENLKPYNPRLYTNAFLRRNDEGTDWEIESSHVRAGGWLYGDGGISNRILFANLCTRCDYSDRVYSAAEYLVRQGKETCRAAGAKLLVFSIPYKEQLTKAGLKRMRRHLANPAAFDPGYPERKLAEICGQLGVEFINGSTVLTAEDYKIRDGHWSRQGNRKVGEAIGKYYRENDPSRPAPARLPARWAMARGRRDRSLFRRVAVGTGSPPARTP